MKQKFIFSTKSCCVSVSAKPEKKSRLNNMLNPKIFGCAQLMTLKVYVRKVRQGNCLISGQQLWVWKVFCTQQLVEVGFAHNLMDVSQMQKHSV